MPPVSTSPSTVSSGESPASHSLPAIPILIFGILAAASLALLASPWYRLAWLPPLGLIFLLFLHRVPEVGFYLIVFLIPFGGFRKIEGPVTINLPWIIAFVLVFVVAIHLLPGKRIPPGLRSNLWPWLLAWFAVSLISTALSSYFRTSLENVALLAAGFLFIGLGMILVKAEALRVTLPCVLVGSVSLSSLLAVVGYYLHIPFLAERHGDILVRGVGGAIDPNNLSLMALYVIPFLVYGIVAIRRWGLRLLCAALILVNLLAIVTTYSRGGALMLAATGLLLLFEYRHRLSPRNVGLMISVVGLALVAFLLLVPQSYWERQASLFSWEDTALSRRSSYVVVGWDASLNHPVLGSGPGTFRDLYAESDFSARYAKAHSTRRRFAHNTYLEVLVGTGLLGLFLFVGALIAALRNYSSVVRRLHAAGDLRTAALVRSYRIAFVVVSLYLLIFSDVYHKLLLVSLAASQVVLHLAPPAQGRTT